MILTQGRILDAEYIKDIYNLRNLLSKIKIECERFEQKVPSRSQTVEFITAKQFETFPLIDTLFDKIWLIIKNLPREPFKYHQIFAQKQLLPYLATPPLNQRINDKPLGYDGDYIMMNYYYQNGFEGNTIFEILMHRYTLHIPMAIATINRYKYFYNQISSTVKRIKNTAKITNIASGSGNEIFEYIINSNSLKEIIFTCIDAEPGAINEIKNKINLLPKPLRDKYKFNLINYNILKYIKASKRNLAIQGQNLIYAAGLFDYLTDKVAQKLIETMYFLLEPGGELILSNFNNTIPSRAYLELIGEWFLILRSDDELIRLCSKIDGKAIIETEIDKQTGTLIYLSVKKPELL